MLWTPYRITTTFDHFFLKNKKLAPPMKNPHVPKVDKVFNLVRMISRLKQHNPKTQIKDFIKPPKKNDS